MGLLNLNTVLSLAKTLPQPAGQPSGDVTDSGIRAEVVLSDREFLAPLFLDADLTNTQPNPLSADDSGVFRLCYLSDGDYRVRFYNATGHQIHGTATVPVRTLDGSGAASSFRDMETLQDDTVLSYAGGRGQLRVAPEEFVQVASSGHLYKVAEPDAEDFHVTSAGGVRLYVNTNRYDLEAAAFGVRLDGNPAHATTNRLALQTAIDHLDRQGQGGRIRLGNEGDCLVDMPPLLKDRIELDLGGGILRNIRTVSDYSGFLSTQTVQVGKMHPRHMDILPWKPLEAAGFGDDAVTLQVAGEADGFQPGDMVLLAEAAAGMGAGKVLPAWAQWNRVHSVSGGLVRLERPMEKAIAAGGGTLGSSAAGAWIANVAARTRHDKNWQSTDLSGWIDGAPFMCYRPSIVNGTLESAHGGAIQGVGMFEGLWENLKFCPGETAGGRGYGGLFSNAFAHSRVRNIVSSSYERAIEVKCLSQHTLIEEFEVHALNHPHAATEDQVSQVALGENSRDVVFRNGVVNLGKLNSGEQDSGLNLINFTPAFDSGFERIKFISSTRWARLVYGQASSRGCFVRDCDFDVEARVCVETEMPDFRFTNNTVRRFTPGTDRYLVRVHGTMARGQINDNDFRAEGPVKVLTGGAGMSGTEICRNRGISTVDDSSGGTRAIVRDNRNTRSDAVLFSGARGEQRNITVTATTQSPVGQAVVIPAGAVDSGDCYTWTITGALAGSGTKTLSWRAAVDTDQDGAPIDGGDDTNVAASFTFPADCTDFEVHVSATIHGTNTIITHARALDLTNNAVLPGGDIGQHSGAALDTRALRLELSGYKAEASAIMIVRSIRRSAERAGFLV